MKVAPQLVLLLSIAATCTAGPNDEELGLHSDGGVWEFYGAQERDNRLPDVLLIGDSIMSGYRNAVIERMKSQANVDCWLTPMHLNSPELHRNLRNVLSHRNYTVVHFNIGLHGWQDGRIPKGRYRELLNVYVAILKDQVPNAKLIWASTTQVHKQGTQTLDDVINPVVVRRNCIAKSVMKEADVSVNDLYALMSDHMDLVRRDRWHWQENAYEIMGQQIARMIGVGIRGVTNSDSDDR